MNKLITIFIAFIMIAVGFMITPSEAQEYKVSGKVYANSDKSVLPGVNIIVKGTTIGTTTDASGYFELNLPGGKAILLFSYIGFVDKEIAVKESKKLKIFLDESIDELEEVVMIQGVNSGVRVRKRVKSGRANKYKMESAYAPPREYELDLSIGDIDDHENGQPHNTEEYASIEENIFLQPTKNPLSTFSIDVDAASYSNIRRFINNGQKPPKDAVRIEEMVNYFNYDYEQPAGEDPFSVNMEMGSCPWNDSHQLVHIGLQGKKIPTENLPASNLVFLIDVSGSMSAPNKLPLLKSSFKMLTKELRAQDKVSIVVYAGAAGLVLPPTSGHNKAKIMSAFDQLQAGGSTAGGAGIKLAYKIAKENFQQEGNNRVILATDGDFNVGASSNAEMERLIEEKRKDKIFLTVLGFGMGNYKDSKMEGIADKGNGNYAYIDNIQEAKKVLVNEFGGTLFTIAKDVKLQVEFNPEKVQAYRLIGYENRKLRKEDFNNDKKDAGDLGSGHTVTAIYEIIPVGVASDGFIQSVDELKYQKTNQVPKSKYTNEMMTLKLRYKQPDGEQSKLIVKSVKSNVNTLKKTSDNFRFSAAVAAYGMILRESKFKSDANIELVVSLAKSAIGKDDEGYRAEFLKMVKSSDFLASR